MDQNTSNITTDFGNTTNLPLARISPSAHLRMLNTGSLAYRSQVITKASFHYRLSPCLKIQENLKKDSRSYCEKQTKKTSHCNVKTETRPETNMKFSTTLQNSTRPGVAMHTCFQMHE